MSPSTPLPRILRPTGPLSRALRDAAAAGARTLLAGIVAGLASVLLATMLARQWWVFDLASHFRVQYVAAAMLGLGLALLLRRRMLALAIVLLSAPHAVAIAGLAEIGTTRATAAEPGAAVRVTTVNAYWANWDGPALIAYVEQADPDILVIQEADRRWRPDLLRIGERFPHAVPENWRRARDVVVFSRFPVIGSGRRLANGRGLDYQIADLEIAGRTVSLIGLHTPSPGGSVPAARRNRFFAEIADYAAAADGPVIAAGDFNSTVWSPHFADLIAASGLNNAADGRGWRPTWPSWLPPAGIAIDHVLASDDFQVESVARGPTVGSDHFPLTVDLTLR